MQKSLEFKNFDIEDDFRNSNCHFHLKGYGIVTAHIVLQSVALYFTNPMGLSFLDLESLLPFLAIMSAAVLGYSLIKKFRPSLSWLGIAIAVFFFGVATSETCSLLQTRNKIDPWVSFVLGINIQTGCCFLFLCKLRWPLSLFTAAATQIYMCFRVIDFSSFLGPQRNALISLVINIAVVFGLTFIGEKEDRNNFQKIRAHNQQLLAYENLIKNVIPSAIIIMRDNKIIFFNNRTKQMLSVFNEAEVVRIISSIQILARMQIRTRKLQFSGPESYLPLKNPPSLLELINDWEKDIQDEMPLNMQVFQTFEGELNSEETAKSLSIQIGPTLWKGTQAMIIFLNDISTIKTHYKDLDAYKDNLLATVSHDLRTPLNGILGILALLLEETTEPEKREKLHITIISAKLLLSMINDILDFSLISKGKLRLRFEETNLTSLVEETVQILSMQANMKGLPLVIENFLSEKDEKFSIDGSRVRQVLLNLIGNAIKFTTQGSVTVRIKEENVSHVHAESPLDHLAIETREKIAQAEANPYLVKEDDQTVMSSLKKIIFFEVEDTGLGIKPEDIGMLFRLFSRATSGHQKSMSGIGLGLAISQSLVRSMNFNKPGAEISVVSEFGKGSKFSFPLYIEDDSDTLFDEQLENIKIKPWLFEPNPMSLRDISQRGSVIQEPQSLKQSFLVLATDDDQINLLVAKSYLECPGSEYALQTAVNGKDAIEKVLSLASQNIYFDLFLMDCNMPIMDGYEASRKLKLMMRQNAIPWAPIVAITANITTEDKVKCLESGMDEFLTKPYMKPQLIRKMKDVLSKRTHPEEVV